VRRIWLVANLNVPEGGRGGRQLGRDNRIEEYFVTEAEALQRCEALAIQKPLTPFGVFGITHIRETAVPTVINKHFNSEGELVVA